MINKNSIILVLLLIIFSLPVNAKIVTCEDAHAENTPFVVYYYTSTCSTCKKFDVIFNKTVSKLDKYNFVKMNVADMAEHKLCYVQSLQYVPSVYIYYPKIKKMGKVHYNYYFNQRYFEYALLTYLSNSNIE